MDGQPIDQGKLVSPGYINADPPGEPFFALTVGEGGVANTIAQAGGSVSVDSFGGINMIANSGSFMGIDSFANITINAVGEAGFVGIDNAGTINFSATGVGEINGLQKVNGSAYPPVAPTPELSTGITDNLTQLTWTQVPMSTIYYADYDIGTTVTSATNIQCTTINSDPEVASSCWLITVTPNANADGTLRFYFAADPGTFDTVGPLYISWLITNP